MVKIISREYIQRVSGKGKRTSGGGNSGGGGVSAGWVDENYLSKEFFNLMFRLHIITTVTVTDSQGEIISGPTSVPSMVLPNAIPQNTEEYDESTGYTTTSVVTIESIEAKAGLWTESYLSALGQNSSGGGGGGATALTDLVDVDISSPSNGQVLKYNSTTGKWENANESGGGGTGTVTSITAGTGLSGGTITSSGTIAINSTYQSYISHGETAYGWGDHANAGYLTSVAFADLTSHPTTLAGYGITDAKIQNGTITLGSNTITPLTSSDLTNLTWWGQSLSNGAVTGSLSSVTDITMSGNIYMANTKQIYFKNSSNSNKSAITVDGSNNLILGNEWRASGYSTYLRGYEVFIQTGSSYTNRVSVDYNGRVHVIAGAQGLRIGDGLITWDSTNNALKFQKYDGTACHIYSTGGVTALTN